MPVTPEYRDLVLEQLGRVAPVTSRAMFGGVGIYSEGFFFALLDDDTLYLKVDDSNRPMFEREGMQPFKPYAARPVTMMYYAVPLAVLESARELVAWARLSISVALKAAGSAPARERQQAARSASKARPARSTAASRRGRTRR